MEAARIDRQQMSNKNIYAEERTFNSMMSHHCPAFVLLNFI